MPIAEQQRYPDTAFSIACKSLWPLRHCAGLAAHLNRPNSTARSWISGRRPVPSWVLSVVSSLLASKGRDLMTMADQIAYDATKAAQIRRMPRGFQIVRPRDGAGSLPRDGRWKGGRARKENTL